MKFDDSGQPLFQQEVKDILSKADLTHSDIKKYIGGRKAVYRNEVKADQASTESEHGCGDCLLSKKQFLKRVEVVISNLRYYFHCDLYEPEYIAIINQYFDYYYKVASYFSINSIGICHFRHFISDVLTVRAFQINSELRHADINLKNTIVKEAMLNDPLGTHIELLEINRELDKFERIKKIKGVEHTDFEREYLDHYKDLEIYASKISPLIVLQEATKFKNSTVKPLFTDLLVDLDGSLVKKIQKHYCNVKAKEIAYLLFALFQLNLIATHPHQLNQTAIHQSLTSLLGNIGTRQALNFALSKVDLLREKNILDKHKRILTQ